MLLQTPPPNGISCIASSQVGAIVGGIPLVDAPILTICSTALSQRRHSGSARKRRPGVRPPAALARSLRGARLRTSSSFAQCILAVSTVRAPYHVDQCVTEFLVGDIRDVSLLTASPSLNVEYTLPHPPSRANRSHLRWPRESQAHPEPWRRSARGVTQNAAQAEPRPTILARRSSIPTFGVMTSRISLRRADLEDQVRSSSNADSCRGLVEAGVKVDASDNAVDANDSDGAGAALSRRIT